MKDGETVTSHFPQLLEQVHETNEPQQISLLPYKLSRTQKHGLI